MFKCIAALAIMAVTALGPLFCGLTSNTLEVVGRLLEEALEYPQYKSLSTEMVKFLPRLTDTCMETVQLGLKFNGRAVSLDEPVYIYFNRFYLPLQDTVRKMGGIIVPGNDNITVKFRSSMAEINVKNNTINNSNVYKPGKTLYANGSTIYISLFDLCKALNFKTVWDIEGSILSLYEYQDRSEHRPVQDSPAYRPALIRLEDVAPDPSSSPEDLERLRIIADYLYSENVPFHIAWIPRYVNPQYGLDNDPSTQYSMLNADYVFTLDYCIDKNALVGLHGYTHQFGSTASIDGNEFHSAYKTDGIPNTEEYVRERLNLAVEAANRLQIPCHFFEVPHYAASPGGFKIMEEYFDFIYEPYTPDGRREINTTIVRIDNGDKTTCYIPTPLNYLDGKKDLQNMIRRLDNLSPDFPASFFFHPYIDFEYIELSEAADGYPASSYSEDSMLHRLVREFRDRGCKFVTIKDIIR